MKKVIYVSSFVISILFLLCFLGCYVVFMKFEVDDISNVKNVVESKRSYHLDSKVGGVLRQGFVSSSEANKRSEKNLFDPTSEENEFLISNTEYREFVCTGRCYCEGEQDRRTISSASSLASRGISCLVAAFTIVSAYERATEFFKNKCSTKFSEECGLSSVGFDMDLCYYEESEDSDDELSKDFKNPEDYRKFWCKGNCVAKKLRNKQSIKAAEEFNCGKLTKRGDIEIYVTEKELEGNSVHQKARNQFKKEFLSDFCKKDSVHRYWYERKNGKGQWLKINLCTAYHRYGDNSNVRCVQVFPRMRKRHNKDIWDPEELDGID